MTAARSGAGQVPFGDRGGQELGGVQAGQFGGQHGQRLARWGG
jgi:hypothetical protein